MNKQEFLRELRDGLSGLPKADVEERVAFYGEMIDDRIEEGLSELEAVAAVGTVEEIVEQTLVDTSILKIAREKINRKRRFSVWEIVLLCLGSPVWLPLLVAALAVILPLYISVWSVIISLWSVFASLVACGFSGILIGIGFAFGVNAPSGLAMIAAGHVCGGFSIFAFYGCKEATKGILWLTKKVLVWAKKCFIKKEAA